MKKRESKPPEDEVFRAAVADVTPLDARHTTSVTKPPARPRRRTRAENQALLDDLSDTVSHHRDAGEPLTFSRPGIQRQAVRQLRRGGSRVEDELDLHGLTVAQARPLLVRFLNSCAQRGVRRVRIIHGKGLRSDNREGVLKGLVASWLAQRADVLAFHEARAAEGGSGAVIVLLRNMSV
jgi:DNA-nicking Smr family endonuclease